MLIVGLNPSKRHGKSPTLKTLHNWMTELGIKHASFTNLYSGYKIKDTECQAVFIRDVSKEYDKVLALGKVVGETLHNLGIDCYCLPHPSGLNRKLNDKKYVHDQLEACKNYLRGDQ